MSAKPKKRKRRLPVPLKPAETASLITQACIAADKATTPAKELAARRDYAMIETALLAGPRVAELCALEVGDIDLTSAVISIKHGKGDVDRNISIGKRLLRVLRWWIGKRKDGYLFPGPNGKKLAPRTFQLRLGALAKQSGIPRPKLHPHALRHSFATALHKKGVSLLIIQRLLGHASVATTQIYASVDVDDMKGAVDLL